MCTVTFIPSEQGFYFTSSRDERSSRTAIPPLKYERNAKELYYPRDEQAGGTWIAASADGQISCLLNGAYEEHKREQNYDRSRGLILLESFDFFDFEEFHEKVNLTNCEPFTLLRLNHNKNVLQSFFEMRWDGDKKHLHELSIFENQIWSSATLYSPGVQEKRKQLFKKWLVDNDNQADRQILNFHNRAHGLQAAEDIIMNGEGDLMTVSISQIIAHRENSTFHYLDLVNRMNHEIIIRNA